MLPQVEARAQFRHRFLPRLHHRGIRRLQQPARQGPLAGVGAGGGEKLEQRAYAEQVQILCVWMRQVQVMVAGAAGAGPGAVQPRQAALVESRRATLLFDLAGQACMRRHQGHEGGGGDQRPQNRDARPCERQPHQRARRRHSSQSPVAKPALAPFARNDGGPAFLVQRRVDVARLLHHFRLRKEKVISNCPPLLQKLGRIDWQAPHPACNKVGQTLSSVNPPARLCGRGAHSNTAILFSQTAAYVMDAIGAWRRECEGLASLE